MKKVCGLILIATLAISSVTAKEKKDLPEVKRIIPVTELTKEKAKEFLDGNYSDIAILCEEGTELPIKFMSGYGPFTVKLAPNLTIKVNRTCYFRVVGKKTYMSYDLIDWSKPDFSDCKGIDVNAGISQDKSCILIEADLKNDED